MTHDVRVYWRSPEERGKRALPPTLRYVGLSRFPEDSDAWPDEAWSVELRFDQPPPEQPTGTPSYGRVRFLVDDAPRERLHSGARFELYEGPTCVADVEIVS